MAKRHVKHVIFYSFGLLISNNEIPGLTETYFQMSTTLNALLTL